MTDQLSLECKTDPLHDHVQSSSQYPTFLYPIWDKKKGAEKDIPENTELSFMGIE